MWRLRIHRNSLLSYFSLAPTSFSIPDLVIWNRFMDSFSTWTSLHRRVSEIRKLWFSSPISRPYRVMLATFTSQDKEKVAAINTWGVIWWLAIWFFTLDQLLHDWKLPGDALLSPRSRSPIGSQTKNDVKRNTWCVKYYGVMPEMLIKLACLRSTPFSSSLTKKLMYNWKKKKK